MAGKLITELSHLAARVQHGRTTDRVLEIAGDGVRRLGMRLAAFQIVDDEIVLRYVATAPVRLRAIEQLIGRPVRSLRAPLDRCPVIPQVIASRENVYREDLDVFDCFLRQATGCDLAPLDQRPATAGIANGVLAPLFVDDRPWGLLTVVSAHMRADDADAVALFATHVGSALEAAEFVETLVEREHFAALGELAPIVAHEVRNPVSVIANAVTLLRKALRRWDDGPSVRDEASKLVSIVGEEAERLSGLVADFLDYGRPIKPMIESASLLELAREVVTAASGRPEAAQVELRVEGPGELDEVGVDVRLVRQALSNLVVNALQAMPSGGVLTVQTDVEWGGPRTRSFARVRVGDTGPGIAPDVSARIFEPFFTTKPTGTGLGLAIVKRVAESHGGRVAFETGTDGTTFTLRLPLDEPGASRRSASPCARA